MMGYLKLTSILLLPLELGRCFQPAFDARRSPWKIHRENISTKQPCTSPGFLVEPKQRNVGRLFSLGRLVDDLGNEQASSGKYPRLVFVGGKGGVGKTTISSAVAVELASKIENDQRILIVSTDPAHSLGDALDMDLRAGAGKPVLMTDAVTGGRLYACEIDAAEALDGFRERLAAFNVEKLADSLGVSPSLLESLGLREFGGLLNNPPPGLDELVALSNILDTRDPNSMASNADVIIVDTAPTGHTLRMLALPAFLDGLLGKLIDLRLKLSGVASTLQAMFGSQEAATRAKTIDSALDRLEQFRSQVLNLRRRLQDSERTSFLVVTVPTKLGVAESTRLIKELSSQGVAVTDVVVNQCVGDIADDLQDGVEQYYRRRKTGQQRWISELKESIKDVSSSKEYQENGSSGPIALTEVPFFDVELVGIPALAYVGDLTFAGNPSFSYLMDEEEQSDEPRVVICGGKGGVGKTTTSSSLAVAMAKQGQKVALVSTDPAHSLGDALDMDLSGGALIDAPLYGAEGGGSLSVMEIDPAAALSEFKGVVDSLVDTPNGDEGEAPNGLGATIRELGEMFDTLPAGTDEVVALAKVVNLIKQGKFTRIVLDTAPTGHTLRMLSTPGFIADLIQKILAVSQKLNANPTVKMLISGSGRKQEINNAQETARSKLLTFQLRMYDLEDLFSEPEKTEFLIVTIATELAVRESIRLLNDLTFEAPDMPIKVRNVVVNQVLSDKGDDSNAFLHRVRKAELNSLEDMKKAAAAMKPPQPEVTEVPYIDTEPRGVYGLKALANVMLKQEMASKA